MMVKNPCLKFVSGLLALGAFFSLLTCSDNVGLGASVDTEAPKVEITYPPASSRIRSTFILAGNCSDDKAVTSVDVQVLDSTKETILKTWTATLAKDAKSWTAEIDSTQLEDGQYYFQAFSHDAANRKSASNDIYYDIDNTAPVLVLTKPTSYGTQEAKGYGQAVQLEGAFSEQGNVIEKLIVSFYDEAGNKLFDNTFSSISDISNANPLVIARYYKDEADETGENYRTKAENVQRWQNYQKLFGEDAIAAYEQGKIVESKQFYFTVTAIDDTCVYTDPVDKTFEDEGNATSIFYRGTNEVLNLINNNNSNFPNFSVRSLRDYINGTDTEYEEDKTKEEELKAILAAAETKSIISEEAIDDTSNWLTFSMNPRNNPTFTVSGFVLDPEKDDKDMYTGGYRNYLTDNPMTLSLATGLDGTNLSTCTITLYYQDTLDADEDGERDNPKKVLWTWNEAVAREYGVTLSRYTATEADANTDALTQQTELTLDDVVLGHKYVIFAEGNDINGQALIASNNRGFGFYASSNVAAPTFGSDDPSQYMNLADMTMINQDVFEDSGFGLSGMAYSSIEVTGMSYTLTVTSGTNTDLSVTTDSIVDGEVVRKNLTTYEPDAPGSTNYKWTYNVEPTAEMKKMISENPGYYIVLIEIAATNGRESVFSRRYYLDNAAPTIGNVTVPSGIEKEIESGTVYYVNPRKECTISGISQDNYSPEITTTLTITGNGSFEPRNSDAKLWTFSNIDLSSFTGEGVTAVITAFDEAGNLSEETKLSLVFDVTGPVLSDNPKDTIGGVECGADTWFNTKSLTAAGQWNDSQSGTKNLYYEVVQEGASAGMTAENYISYKSVATDNGAYSMTATGFENGTNTLRCLATDNVDNVSALVEHTVKIDIDAPVITAVATTTLSNATADVEIPLEISDAASGIKTVVLKAGSDIVPEKIGDVVQYSLTADASSKKYVKLTLTKAYLETLDEGYHAMSLEVTDAAGNMATQSIGTLNIDITKPSITITPATNYFIKDNIGDLNSAVEAIVSDASGIQHVTGDQIVENQIVWELYRDSDLESDGSPKTGAVKVTGGTALLTDGKATISGIDTSDSFDSTLTTGTKLAVRITATDKAGNSFSRNTAFYTIDKTPPSIGSSVTDAPKNQVGGKIYDPSVEDKDKPWYKDAALAVLAPWTEDGIGIKAIYYQVIKDGDTTTSPMNSSNYAEKGTAVSTTVVTKATGKYEEFNTTIGGFQEAGKYKVWFIAVDKLNNVSSPTDWTIQRDGQAPNIVRLDDGTDPDYPKDADYDNSKAFDKVTLTNGNSATLYFCATDELGGSGINPDDVTVKLGSSEITLSESGSKITTTDLTKEGKVSKYKFVLSLAKADLENLSGYQAVTVTVKDKADNPKSVSIGTLNIDTVAPKVSFTSPAEGSSVNKVVTVSGKATDANAVTSVTLTATYGSRTKTYTFPASDTADGTISYDSGVWTASLDTSDYAEETAIDLTLTVSARDEAGNVSEDGDSAGNTTAEMTRKVSLDQNTDRPVIQLMNVKAKAGTLTQKTVNGAVSDDDGPIAAGDFYVSENTSDWYSAESNDSPLTYNNGSWVYTLKDNTQGPRKLYFKVKDAKGAEFASDKASNLSKPYVRGMNYTSGEASDVDTYLSYTLDTLPPEIDTDDCGIKWTDTAGTSYSEEEKYVNGILFGRTKSKTFDLTVYASDVSGIKKMTAKLGSADEVSIEGNQIEDKPTTDKNYRRMGIIHMEVPDTAANGETMDLVITVTDNNGAEANVSRGMLVDNVAPDLTVDSPKSGQDVITSTEIRGTTRDGDNGVGTKEIRYYVPTNAEITSWTSGGNVTVPSDVLSDTTNKFKPIYNKDDSGKPKDELSTGSWNISFTGAQYCDQKLSDFFIAVKDESGKITGYTQGDYGEDTDREGIWKLPVYFYVKDKAENYKVVTSYYINVNPDGDKPTAKFTYPLKDDYDKDPEDASKSLGYITLGGSIRITGEASDNEEVSSVHLQIQKAKYDANKNLPAMKDSDTEMDADYEEITDESGKTYSDVLANGTSSWTYVIDGETELFGVPENCAQSRIRVRAWAIDNNNTRGVYTDWVYITIDTTAPRIGSTKPLTLVQYKNNEEGTGDIEASQSYVYGTYISGTWWLVFSAEDDTGIADVKTESVVKDIKDDGSVGLEFKDPETNPDIPEGKGKNYRLKITTTGTGNVKFNLKATDTSTPSQSSLSSVYLQFDNTPPEQSELYHGVNVIGDGTNGTVKVVEDNKTFLIKSSVIENGSGLERVAMYLKRPGSANRIYDPRFANTKDANDDDQNRIELDDSAKDRHAAIDEEHENLPYRRYTATRSTDDSFTLSAADSFITKASIVKIKGVYRLITKVDGTTYSFTPADESRDTTVDVIYALIIDNTKAETITNGVPGGDGKDGDLFYDQVSDDGSSYTWKAAFTSTNIPDGPLDICYVAFDAAQNASALETVHTFVANNTPRIARVYLGTDLSGADSEGKHVIDQATETVNYSMLKQNTDGLYEAVEEAEVNAIYRADGKTFIAKDYSEVWVELVGGNGNLYAAWKGYAPSNAESLSNITWNETPLANVGVSIDATSDETLANSKIDTETGGTETINGESVSTRRAIIKHEVADDKLSGIADGYVKTVYNIWDSTEETTPGTNSQKAKLTVMFEVDVVDNTAPAVQIDPFYWRSAGDNSLFGNSSANGHIELEADWTAKSGETYLTPGYSKYKAGTEGYTGKEYDEDPKVSGKISIRGSAIDNTRLTEIWAHIDDFAFTGSDTSDKFGFDLNGTASETEKGTYYKLAEYSVDSSGAASWTGSGDANLTNGWQFTATGSAGQDGHSITWQLDLDTSKITNAAGADKNIRIIAVDGRQSSGQNNVRNASPESAKDAGENGTGYLQPNKPAYQVDVVPYVTGVETTLTSLKRKNPSVFNRTALGHYPLRYQVKYDDEGNLDTVETVGETIKIKGFNLKEDGSVSIEKTVGTDITQSGNFTLAVSGVNMLNNENLNDARGDYTTSESLNAKTGTYSIYHNYYNRQPNNDNNNLLTDDVVFDVWQITPQAAKPINGYATQPVMAINPVNHDVGFAFVNGTLYYSMPDGKTTNPTSYQHWIGGYDFWTSVGLAYDSAGYAYGTAAGGDIADNRADTFRIMTSRWGTSDTSVQGYDNGKNNYRLEYIAQADYDSEGNLTRNFNKERVRSPSLATTGATADSTTVYLAYYDEINDEIRFKWGTFTNTTQKDWKSNRQTDAQKATFFGDYYGVNKDGYNSESDGKNTLEDHNGDYRLTHNSLIAGKTAGKYTKAKSNGASGATTLYSMTTAVMTNETTPKPVYAGKYVSIAAIENGGTSDDAIVAVWWDAENSQLLYSYNLTPKSIKVGQYSQAETKWSTPVAIFGEGIGEYCKVAVDKNEGVHIAAYDGLNGDLWYAYVSDFKKPSGARTCIVDSYGIIGTELNIDVALDASSYPVPYISYYAGSCARPKIAHWAKAESIATASLIESADEEVFTGTWEVSLVPTASKVSVDHINVGVWKDGDGKITESTNNGNIFTAGANGNGTVWGNGTSNAILGYAITKGSNGYIETAQKK